MIVMNFNTMTGRTEVLVDVTEVLAIKGTDKADSGETVPITGRIISEFHSFTMDSMLVLFSNFPFHVLQAFLTSSISASGMLQY